MRNIALTLTALLLASPALAQYDPKEGVVITHNPATGPTMAQTVPPAEPIQSNPIPFNTQRPQGDGVPVQATPPAYIGQTGAVPPSMIPAPQPGSTPGAPPMQAAPTPPPGGGMGLGKIFDEADTNRDNVVTRDEFIAKANQHFGMADKNKDNKITREEMQAQQSEVMQQMQKNLFGNGTLQNKIDQFMGTGRVAPANLAPTAPTPPSVPRPVAPAVPTSSTH